VKFPAIFRVKGAGYTAMNLRCDSWFSYVPLTLRLTEPNYRNCIYATQSVDEVRGTVSLGLPLEQARGFTVRTSLSGVNAQAVSTDAVVEDATVAFSLPCKDLPEGSYVVRA